MLEASAPAEARCAAPAIVRYLIARLFQPGQILKIPPHISLSVNRVGAAVLYAPR